MHEMIGGAVADIDQGPINGENAKDDRKNGVAGKVGKRAGSAALRGAGWTARLAGRSAWAGGKAAVSSGRRAGKRRKD